ncbi:hypothetical protein DSUL_60202 [Desulfovibrionales bacterium]
MDCVACMDTPSCLSLGSPFFYVNLRIFDALKLMLDFVRCDTCDMVSICYMLRWDCIDRP